MNKLREKQRSTLLEAIKEKGHTLKLNSDGEPDIHVMSSEFHNGPGCTTCHWTCCEHCSSPANVPECTAKGNG